MNLTELREQIKNEKTRAYKLKTKKAKENAYKKIRDLEWSGCEYLYERAKAHGPQSMRATILHFRAGDDRFLVDTAYGKMWLTPTLDVLAKSWYPHTCCIEYSVGQEIVLEFNTEVNTDGLFLEIVPQKTYGGRVNETQYAELDKRDDLAFFRHSNSDGFTGLFAQKKTESA